jgi:hypothetical protein
VAEAHVRTEPTGSLHLLVARKTGDEPTDRVGIQPPDLPSDAASGRQT